MTLAPLVGQSNLPHGADNARAFVRLACNDSDAPLDLAVTEGALFPYGLPAAIVVGRDGATREVLRVRQVTFVSGTSGPATLRCDRGAEPGATAYAHALDEPVDVVPAAWLWEQYRAYLTRAYIDVQDYGAVGDGLSTVGYMDAGSTTLRVRFLGTFSAADVGKRVAIWGAGPAGATLCTTIVAMLASDTVQVAHAASTKILSGLAYDIVAPATGTTAIRITAVPPPGLAYPPQFVAGDVGDPVYINSGGPDTTPLVRTISAVAGDGMSATVSAPITLPTGAAAYSTAYNALPVTYGTDDTAAFQAALGALPQQGGRLWVPPGIYLLSSTLSLPSHCKLEGQYSGSGTTHAAGSSLFQSGTTLAWAGAPATVMLRIYEAAGTHVRGLSLSGEGGAGVTGLLLDADGDLSGVLGNGYSSKHVVVEDINFWHCAVGMQWGSTAGLPRGQNDASVLRNFWVQNYSITQATSIGVLINAINTQISVIEQGTIQGGNCGIKYRVSGLCVKAERVNFGGVNKGVTPRDIWITQSASGGALLFENCQGESGTQSFFIDDKLADGVTLAGNSGSPVIFLACHFDEPGLVQGVRTVVTLGCGTSGLGLDIRCAHPLAQIVDLGSYFNNGDNWVMAPGCTALTQLGRFNTLPNLRLGGPAVPLGDPTGYRPLLRKNLTTISLDWNASTPGGPFAAGETRVTNVAVAGVAFGDPAFAVPVGGMPPGMIWSAQGWTGGTVQIRLTNVRSVTSDPIPTLDWNVGYEGYAKLALVVMALPAPDGEDA